VESVDPLGRRERLWLAAILLVGLALRLACLFEQRSDILFEHPVLDEQRYVEAARALVAGTGDPRPYWQPPGIIYALAACFRLLGPGLLAPRVLQALLSTAACLLVFLIGRRVFNVRTALVACAMTTLHGVLVFESTELLPPTWMMSCDLLALWLLLRGRDSARWSFAGGLALGVSAVFSPVVLPFSAPVMVWLRKPRLIAALLVGLLLPIAPVTARNWSHSHEWVLVSTNGGLNFYIGNNADYARTFAMRPGRHWQEMTSEARRSGIEPVGAQSSYYTRKALAFFGAQPGRALALQARKLYLFFNGREIPRDTDIQAARQSSRVLRVLVWPWLFPDGILIPLALVGVALTWSERRKLWLLLAFLALQALCTAVFFVSARHRVPSLAVFALFAAAGANELLRRRHLVAAGALLVACVLLNLPTREAAASYAAELDFYRGVACQRETREPLRAIEYFRRSIAVDPSDARAWFELGNTYQATGQPDAAVDAWRRAAERDPWDSRPLRAVSSLLMRRGDLDGAIAALTSNLDARQHEPAHYLPDHLNLAFLLARRGHHERAVESLRAAKNTDAAGFREQASRMARAVDQTPELRDTPFNAALRELLAP
jgi:tetratricopeptide (TPR) repeat protein